MENQFYEALEKIAARRKSIRIFSDRKVPAEYIEKIMNIAGTSPYASGRKNWGVEIIGDKKTITIAAEIVKSKAEELKRKVRSDFTSDFLEYARYFTSFETAHLIFVPYYREAPVLSLMMEQQNDDILIWERDNIIKSISCVAMLIILAAASLGLDSCYITGALIADQELNNLFKIKTGRSIGAIIPIGYREQGAQNGY